MKTLISELEDSIRRQEHPSGPQEEWADVRTAYIYLAAWLMMIVKNGDKRAASQAQAQDSGGDSESEKAI